MTYPCICLYNFIPCTPLHSLNVDNLRSDLAPPRYASPVSLLTTRYPLTNPRKAWAFHLICFFRSSSVLLQCFLLEAIFLVFLTDCGAFSCCLFVGKGQIIYIILKPITIFRHYFSRRITPLLAGHYLFCVFSSRMTHRLCDQQTQITNYKCCSCHFHI